MVKNRIGILWGIIALCVLIGGGALSAQESQPTVGLVPSAETMTAGDDLSLQITVQDAEMIYGVGFTLSYDPAAYEALTTDGAIVQPGDFFADKPSFTAANRANAESGQIEYAMTLTRPATPVSGDGLLGTVRLRALADGPVNLQLSDVQLLAAVFEEVNGEVIASGVVEIPAMVLDIGTLAAPVNEVADSDSPDSIEAFLRGIPQSDATLPPDSPVAADGLTANTLIPVIVLLVLGLVFFLLGLSVYRGMRQSMKPVNPSERS